MTIILRLVKDERSAIAFRHARIASLLAAIGVVAGIFLTVAGSQLHEQSSRSVLWALACGRGALGA